MQLYNKKRKYKIVVNEKIKIKYFCEILIFLIVLLIIMLKYRH